MTYTGNDLAAQARSYSSTASAATRRADREAERAAGFYRTAATVRGQARWLASRPDRWTADYTPAELDAQARSWTRLGDTFLRTSFGATASAEFYRDLAASYRGMQARREASMAQLDADLAARAAELADEADLATAQDWPEDQIDAMMPEEDQERFAALRDAADAAVLTGPPVMLTLWAGGDLVGILPADWWGTRPLCQNRTAYDLGGAERGPLVPWDEPQAEADVVAEYAACWQAQAEDDAQLAAWETDGGACLVQASQPVA
jgi:hypothetical protein